MSITKIFQRIGIVRGDNSESRAFFHSGALSAVPDTLLQCAFADGAEVFAVESFDPVSAASGAVDVFRQNCGVIQFAPQFRRFFTQGVIVVFRRDVCVALFAVKAAVADSIKTNSEIGMTFK